jgi:5-methyltetrahydrofolate--homocysteine methyltransferase
MKKYLIDLVTEEFVVLDGALGTLLQQRGLTSQNLPEEWNIHRPDVVRDIHLDYLKSGAQIITTNTFGGSPLKLGASGKESLFEEVNKRGVDIARKARAIFEESKDSPGDQRYIAGSVGPTGKICGMNINVSEVEKNFAMQAGILANAGVDLFIVETMFDASEAEIAVNTLKKETNIPVFVSLVFNKTKNGEYRTLFGNTVPDAATRMEAAGATAMGTNCGLVDEYIDVIREMRKFSQTPLLLYPNAGTPKLKNGVTSFNQSAQHLISYLERSIEAGATIIGGCCGTTPEYIALVAQGLDKRKRNV